MLRIQNITDAALQQQTIVLPNGNSFNFTMNYIPMQYGWFITNLVYQDFVLNGLRITNNPNMLFPWINIIPFGLACFSPAQREPTQQQDFLSGASNLYILTHEECVAYKDYLSGGALPA